MRIMQLGTGRAWSSLLLVFGSLSTYGCATQSEPTFDVDLALNRTLVPVVALGTDPNEPGFTDIRGYGVDSQGRIWVGEYSGLVHTFQPDGRLLRTWDRRGQGPGEFGNILALDTDPVTQRIAVRESAYIKVLTEDLQELTRWLIPRVPGGSVLPGLRFDPGRSALLFSVAFRRDSIMQDTLRLVWTPGMLLRAGEDGTGLDTIGSLVGNWSMLFPGISSRSSPPTAGTAIWLPADTTGFVVGDGHQAYELHLLSATGDTIRTFHRSLPEEVLRNNPGPRFTRGFVQRAAYDSRRRELLACRTQPEGGGGYFDTVEVDHFSLEGEYLGTLTWPGCPRYVSTDGTVFLNTRGALGVPIVLGFRYAGEV